MEYIAKKGKNIALWSLSTGTYLFIDYFFDFFLYYFAIRTFGPLYGGGGVLLLGICIDLLVLYMYDRGSNDLFGFEEIKKIRDYTGENKWRNFLSKSLKRTNFLAMCILAFYSNPCLTTIYMRPAGEKRRNMNLRDLSIFIFSFFVDVFWILIVYSFVKLEYIIRIIIA